jgi:leucyl aminopeptidase
LAALESPHLPDRLNSLFVPHGSSPDAKPIWLADARAWPAQRDHLPAAARIFTDATGFKPEPGAHLLLPGADGSIAGALFALDEPASPTRNALLPGKLAAVLPSGVWRFDAPPPDARLAALAFALGAYRFTRYRK